MSDWYPIWGMHTFILNYEISEFVIRISEFTSTNSMNTVYPVDMHTHTQHSSRMRCTEGQAQAWPFPCHMYIIMYTVTRQRDSVTWVTR